MADVYTITCEDAISFCVDAAWGFGEINPDGKFVWVNPAFCQILNAPPDLIIGTSFRDWTHPDDVEIDATLKGRVKTGEISSFTLSKRYIQRGSTPQNMRVIWGILSVSGKWSTAKEFLGYRIQFRPYDTVSSLHQVEWKAYLEWLIKNWKSISIAILTLTSLIFGGSETLLSVLRKAKDTKDSVEQVLESSRSGVSSQQPTQQ